MDQNQSQGNLWFGLLFAAVGGLIMLLAVDVIHSPEENFHAPRWVVLLAGMCFFGAGAYVSLIDPRFSSFLDAWWFRLVVKAAQYSIPISLLLVLNWVAFGPGEREFSASVSAPFFSISTQNAGQIMGRCVFGSFAVLCDAVLVFLIANSLLKRQTGGKRDED